MSTESIGCQETVTNFSVTWAGRSRAYIVASVRSPADAEEAARESYIQIAQVLRERRLWIVQERIFGSLSVAPSVMKARNDALDRCAVPTDNPVTYVQGHPPWGEGFAGAIIHAVSPTAAGDVWTITDRGNPCGRGWRSDRSIYLVLQNISGKPINSNGDGKRHLGARHALERAERILRENGASYRDVVRTWFYLSDILEWYATFNKVRNEKYGEFGIMPGPGDGKLLLPASTGIGGDTPSGSAATVDLIAILGETGSRTSIKQLSNETQLDAFRYGSAFSRGALIEESDVSVIEISGTAAIDRRGKSQFVDDIRGQITCTFDKIERLIGTESAKLTDMAAATVFVKRPEHAALFWEMAIERGLGDFPAVCMAADVCREELLFEIDGEAVIDREIG